MSCAVLCPVFLQKIGAIIEQPRICEPWDGNKLAADRIVLDDAREEGFDLVVFKVLLQINRMRGCDALPPAPL